MEISYTDLKEKEIINIVDGRKLGRVVDILFDVANGLVRGIVVPGEKKIFRKSEDIFVPLEKVRKIGNDVVLVSLPFLNENRIQINGGYNEYRSNKTNQSSLNGGAITMRYNVSGGQTSKTQDVRLKRANNGSFVRYKRIDNKKYK